MIVSSFKVTKIFQRVGTDTNVLSDTVEVISTDSGNANGSDSDNANGSDLGSTDVCEYIEDLNNYECH